MSAEKVFDLDSEEGEEEEEPPRPLTDEDKQYWIRSLPIIEGCYESPIDINITKCISYELPPLEWYNFNETPKKTKITNTGHTIIYSARWPEERPFIKSGPLTSKYVFSNFHLHWGETALEGSEHTIDGAHYPGELHVVFFKSSYFTQESALKEQDGCCTVVYMIKLQEATNKAFQIIIDSIANIKNPGSSKRIENIILTRLFREFTDDYFMYWGSVSTENCVHFILWLITRVPIAISMQQLDALRYLFDHKGTFLTKNFRPVQRLQDRSLFHVNPSVSQYSTLLEISPTTYMQYQVTKILYYKDMKLINQVVNEFLSDPESTKGNETKCNNECV